MRELAGGASEDDIAPSPYVRPLVEILCAKFGDKFREYCMDGDKISKSINILINGKHYAHLGGENAPIQPNDEIIIYPQIGGG